MEPSPSRGQQQLLSEDLGRRDESPRKPSLLPAFEPLSSSPFPRPQSAQHRSMEGSPSLPKQQIRYYPTPVPTSSTGILPSSSPHHARQGPRHIAILTERRPLGDMPLVELPADGEVVKMGRSSNSSDYQLSANRLISRVHVQAAYHPITETRLTAFVEIECLGWNGAKIHCRGSVYELQKGESHISEDPQDKMILDVQDTRVTIVWPQKPRPSWDSDDDLTPSRRSALDDSEDDRTPSRRSALDPFASSPPAIPRSPVSQSPVRQPMFMPLAALGPAPVQIFEDADAEDGASNRSKTPTPADVTFVRPSISRSSSANAPRAQNAKRSFDSSFGEELSDDENEENDPIVHSFGPFGENILPRFASFSTDSPTQAGAPRRRQPLVASRSPRRPSLEPARFKESPIKYRVINQLAYANVHSIPLSAIYSNLPAELRACAAKSSDDKGKSASSSGTSTPSVQLSKQDLKKMLDEIPCVGEIPRSGKDAAGKALENEFYYIPEMDTDMSRREVVTSAMRGSGLRSVRKQHKQYFWKRPRV